MPKVFPVYNKNDLDISIQLQRNADGLVNLLARFRNVGFSSPIVGINLQAAVPKSQKLQLQPISSGVLEGGGEATQAMRVAGSKMVSDCQMDLWPSYGLLLTLTLLGTIAAFEAKIKDTVHKEWTGCTGPS